VGGCSQTVTNSVKEKKSLNDVKKITDNYVWADYTFDKRQYDFDLYVRLKEGKAVERMHAVKLAYDLVDTKRELTSSNHVLPYKKEEDMSYARNVRLWKKCPWLFPVNGPCRVYDLYPADLEMDNEYLKRKLKFLNSRPDLGKYYGDTRDLVLRISQSERNEFLQFLTDLFVAAKHRMVDPFEKELKKNGLTSKEIKEAKRYFFNSWNKISSANLLVDVLGINQENEREFKRLKSRLANILKISQLDDEYTANYLLATSKSRNYDDLEEIVDTCFANFWFLLEFSEEADRQKMESVICDFGSIDRKNSLRYELNQVWPSTFWNNITSDDISLVLKNAVKSSGISELGVAVPK
jgi:hypothetical protein